MGRKISYDAADKKAGMSLEELKTIVDEATGMAKINETTSSKVTVFVNINGGIKQLIAEV
jgi:hypothetical protein